MIGDQMPNLWSMNWWSEILGAQLLKRVIQIM